MRVLIFWLTVLLLAWGLTSWCEARTVEYTWTAPSTDTEGQPLAYPLSYRAELVKNDTVVSQLITSQTKTYFTNVKPGTYHVRVQAMQTKSSYGPPSQSLLITVASNGGTTPPPTEPPGVIPAPTNLTVQTTPTSGIDHEIRPFRESSLRWAPERVRRSSYRVRLMRKGLSCRLGP